MRAPPENFTCIKNPKQKGENHIRRGDHRLFQPEGREEEKGGLRSYIKKPAGLFCFPHQQNSGERQKVQTREQQEIHSGKAGNIPACGQVFNQFPCRVIPDSSSQVNHYSDATPDVRQDTQSFQQNSPFFMLHYCRLFPSKNNGLWQELSSSCSEKIVLLAS